MERLTIRIDGEAREDHSLDAIKWKNGNRACMERLAKYEDSGLTPEQVTALQSELEQVKRERDAAVRDFEDYIKSHNEVCAYCIHDDECEPQEMLCIKWHESFKWRGLCAENGGLEQHA